MDAQTFVSLMIQKLESLLPDHQATTKKQKQVKTALRYLHLLNQSITELGGGASSSGHHSLNDQRVARLLPALYSAEDVTILLTREELQNMIRNDHHQDREKYSFKKLLLLSHWPLRRPILSRYEFIKIFKKEVKALSSSSTKEAATLGNLSIEDVLVHSTMSVHNEKDQRQDPIQRQRRWERISGFCLEEETTNAAVLEQEVTKELVAQLLPKYKPGVDHHQFDHESAAKFILILDDRQGAGKTTLSKALYDRVKQYFEERLRVDFCLGQLDRDVLATMLMQTTEADFVVATGGSRVSFTQRISYEELKWKLAKLVAESRCLIVMDNVERRPKFLKDMQEVLRDSNRYGGRMIVTTSKEDVLDGGADIMTLDLRQFSQVEKENLGNLLLGESTTNPMSDKQVSALSNLQVSEKSFEDAKDHGAFSGHSTKEAVSNLNIKDYTSDNITHSLMRSEYEEEQPCQRQHQDKRFVHFKEKLRELVAGLISENNHYDDTQVIAVVGERGSGKTTMVRAVFSSVDVKRRFAKRAWVCVASEYKTRNILFEILKQIKPVESLDVTVSEEELVSRLTELFALTRYLIVLEDVVSCQLWEGLRDILTASSHSAKIIMTTNNQKVVEALAADSNSTVSVRRLNDYDSWKLFLNKVQIAEDVFNDSELITLKEKILKICGGLPLSIVLLGGLLSAKEVNFLEWSRVIERLDNNEESILNLSYQELPSKVKPCFLYMGLFPRAFEIPVRRLIHLWCAEGFVGSFDIDQDICPEDLAEMYFEELVIRNVIQVTRWRPDGTPKTCRMLNVLYDIFSSEAAKAGMFYQQLHSSHTSAKQPPFTVRRLAANSNIIKNFPSSILEVGLLHSYVAFDAQVQCSPAREISKFLNKIITKRGFGLLTVLDLEGVYKPTLSDEIIGKLLWLSYLGLRSTFIDSLPRSVGNLLYLETLDVRHTKIRNLPSSLWGAKKLRHLYLNWLHSYVIWPPPDSMISELKLHTLWGICIKNIDERYDFQKNLTRLRKLGVRSCSRPVLEKILQQASHLTKLRSLKLQYVDMEHFLSTELDKMAKHEKLQELYLSGMRLTRKTGINNFDDSFPNLRILTLSMSEIPTDPMPELGRLPHLNILRLFGNSFGGGMFSSITCPAGGFPQLHVLKLWKLELTKCTVEERAMPCLRELEIRSCGKLKQFKGLQHVSTLKELVLTSMPAEFETEVKRSLSENVYVNVHAAIFPLLKPTHSFELVDAVIEP